MSRDFDAQQAIDDLSYRLGNMSHDDYQAANANAKTTRYPTRTYSP